jgi:hypothetical protein
MRFARAAVRANFARAAVGETDAYIELKNPSE